MASRAAILRAARAGSPGAASLTYPPQGGSPWIGQLPSYGAEPGPFYAPGYGPFMPRPPQVFTEGAFGPFPPILPVPADQPPPGSPRAQPRRFQYQVGWNLPIGVPGSEGYKLASFQTLQTLAETYSILRTCLERRKNEIRALDWDITLTPEAAKEYQGSPSKMADFMARRKKARAFFRRPDPNYYTFEAFVHAMMDQVFVLDALSLYQCPKKGRGMGRGLFGSDLDCLWLLDGSTIRPLLDLHGGTPQPPAPGYQQFLYGVPRSDLAMMVEGLDLDEAGLSAADIRTEMRSDQLIYHPYLQRPQTVYGFSLVEQALIPIMTGLRKQAMQLDFFTDSTVPRVYISPGDSTLTPNQLREMQDALNAVAGDIAWAFKIQVLPPGSKVLPVKEMEIVDQADEWIATEVSMVCCAMGTDVLTRQGLKAIENVRPGDQVMTHRGRWQPVTKVMRSPVGDRQVRQIKAHGFDALEVTSDHPVWGARYHRQGTRARQYQGTEWLPAGDVRAAGPRGDFDCVTLPVPVMGSADATLRPGDHVKGCGRYKVWEENGRLRHTRRDVQSLPAQVPMGAALGRLLGFYMAEGSTGTSQVFFAFHEDEVAYHQMVVDDLETVFGLRSKMRYRPETHSASVLCQSPLLRDLFSCGTATSKSLPEWAWDGSPEFYASLLWAWTAGDGWIASMTDGPTRTRFDGWRGYTASRTLAWQMRMVALACGHPCAFHLRKQPESSIRGRALRNDRGIHVLEMRRKINPKRPGWYQIESGLHLTSAVRSNDVAPYDGEYVYNLEVGEDHSYVTTGGTVHNCDITPMEIGVLPKISTVASPFAAREMAQANRSIRERTATKPTLAYVQSVFNFILQQVCRQDDMQFTFEGMQEVQDQAATTDMLVKQVQSGLRSIDEARDQLHLTPWDLPETREPVVFTQMGPVPLDEAVQQSLSQIRQAITGSTDDPQAQAAVESLGRRAAASGLSRRKALPAGSSSQGRMNGPVTQRQARRGGALAPAHARAEGSPGMSGSKNPSKAAAAELEALERHLCKGMHISEWVPVSLPGHVMASVGEDLEKGLSAAYACRLAASLLPKAAGTPQERQEADRRQVRELEDRYAREIAAALTAALAAIRALIGAWLAGTLAVTAMVLASMILAEVRKALAPVLDALWTDAWREAEAEAGGSDEAALEAFLATWGAQWLEVISGTGEQDITAAIRQALASGDPESIIAAVAAIIFPPGRPVMIAATEVTRAWNAAILAIAKLTGIAWLRWQTRDDDRVCNVCKSNQNGSPVPSGAVFPSGLKRPPQHPSCRCRLVPVLPPKPALTGKRAKSRKALRREVGLNGQETWTDVPPPLETTGGRVFHPHAANGTEYQPDWGVPGATTGGEPPRWDGSEPFPYLQRAPDADDDAAYGSAAGIGARPGTYWPAPYMDGWWPAPHGHGTQQAPATSIGAANGRPPSPAGKALNRSRNAVAVARKAPGAKASAVFDLMRENFPASSLGWVRRIRWSGPVGLPCEMVDSSGRKKWAASHESGHVDEIAAKLRRGEDVNPGIVVIRKGHLHARMIDGRHRLLAAEKAGKPYRCYVGWLDEANETAAYDTYHQQVHSGDDPRNKSFTAGNLGLPGNVSGLTPFNLLGAPPEPSVAGLAVRAADTGRVLMIQRARTDGDPAGGLFEFGGGHLEDGELPLEAALREWSEEVGHPCPPGEITGHWRSSDGGYEGFVLTVPREDGLDLSGPREIANPDGDFHEPATWWSPGLVDGNPAVRSEIRRDWPLISAALGSAAVKSAETPALEATPHPLGTHGLWHTPDRHVPERQKLPNYVEHIAAALMRDQDMGESQAIATAISAIRRWARGDLHWGSRRKVTPEVRAASQRALAEWQQLRASHPG